jgi:hypothetical protein
VITPLLTKPEDRHSSELSSADPEAAHTIAPPTQPGASAPATTTFQSTLLMLVPITTFKPWGIDAIG